MIRRPPRSTLDRSSAASDVYKRQVVTFLMVFLIQNTQNRDARAIHLKLDELLRATPGARREFMEAEEEDLDEIEREKAIVDEDDPAPPEERAHGHAIRERQGGNGK